MPNTKEAEIMLNDLHSESRKYGLKINQTKTKLMVNDNISPTPVKLEDSEIELTTTIYLGQKISLQEPNQVKRNQKESSAGMGSIWQVSHHHEEQSINVHEKRKCSTNASYQQ